MCDLLNDVYIYPIFCVVWLKHVIHHKKRMVREIMGNKNLKNKKYVLPILWLIEGMLVGFGAILPGVSGGTLCVAFGMYRPIIETISDIRNGLRKYGVMLVFFVLGAAFGFVGLSGLAAWLLEKNTVMITCLFIGFVFGTLPALWKDAGAQGRTSHSFVGMCVAFVVMVILLATLNNGDYVTVAPGLFGFALCGILWGLSFIVPGLSSSTLLLFFGLYQPMLEGIASFDFAVILPLAAGMIVCVLALTKVVQSAYEKNYALISHCIIGIVTATTVMVFPFFEVSSEIFANCLAAIVIGIFVSLVLTKFCDSIQNSQSVR